MRTGRYNIKTLLTETEIEQIVVPELQRDYVWEEQNVEGLLTSIYENSKRKTGTSLTVMAGGKAITPTIEEYLKEEYSKLVFNTRIGFIYAYHSAEYAGKYYLIDGQQRMTTLYLLLLALYVKTGKTKEFGELYFVDKKPKLDYKVREISHCFMVDFVDFYMDAANKGKSFTESEKYYDLYLKDETAKHLFDNYKLINQKLTEWESGGAIKCDDFLEYIENYVELNYFDTNKTSQGERLYIYMNSRGEGLSDQERLRPLIVGREKQSGRDSTIVGKCWEEWQDFFWRYKGGNENADNGFQEFIKWTVLIHMVDKNGPIKAKRTKTDGSLQSDIDVMADYVQCTGNVYIEQQKWIRDYQKQAIGYDFAWIKSVFDALREIASYSNHTDYIKDKWLSKIEHANDYIVLLPCLYYLVKFPKATSKEVKRIGMFFKNACSYEINSSEPLTATIMAMQIIKGMTDSDIINYPFKDKDRFYSPDSDSFKNGRFGTPYRYMWEETLWKIVNDGDGDFNRFIKGNLSFFVEWDGLNSYTDETDRIKEFERHYIEFKGKVYEKVSQNPNGLLMELLEYGDFQEFTNSYVGWRVFNHKDLPKWKMPIENDANARTWDKNLRTPTFRKILLDYLTGGTKKPGKLYGWLVSGDQNVLGIMSKHLLVEEGDRVVLMKKETVKANLCYELMIAWIDEKLNSKVHGHKNDYRTYYVDFDYNAETIIYKWQSRDELYIQLEYNWRGTDAYWTIRTGHRDSSLTKSVIPALGLVKSVSSWSLVSGVYEIKDFLKDDFSKSIADRVEDVQTAVNVLFTSAIL